MLDVGIGGFEKGGGMMTRSLVYSPNANFFYRGHEEEKGAEKRII
jgi:hypothetical protein